MHSLLHQTCWTIGALLAVSIPGAVLASAGPADAGDAPRQPAATQLAAADADGGSPTVGVAWHGTWSDWSDAEREAALDRMVEAGVTWVRLDIGWSTLQPEGPGSWSDWYAGEIDRILDMAAERDLRVLAMVWRTPAWATSGDPGADPPDQAGDYARAAEWLAQRFGDRVDAWQVWNEPNLDSFWTGTAEGYGELLAAAAPRIRAADAGTPVVLGGLSTNDDDWLADLYAAGSAGDFDVLAVHPYPQPADDPPDLPDDGTPVRTRHVEAIRELMVQQGDADVPIWFTEVGWSVHDNRADTPSWARGVSAQTQADHSMALLDMVAGDYPFVENVFFYNLRNKDTGNPHQDNFGLLTRDLSPKPVYDALARRLTNTTDPVPDDSVADGDGDDGQGTGDDPVSLERIAGSERIKTAVKAARAGWDHAETVVIARADDPVDALAGAALAGHEQAPLLVTWPGALHGSVATAIAELGAQRAMLLGGTAALSPDVAGALEGRGLDVQRVAGAHRSQTAARIAARVGDGQRVETAVVVGGAQDDGNWPDALAASAWTASRNHAQRPTAVLLAGESVPPATREALQALAPAEVIVVGGPSVVPDDVVEALGAGGRDVTRLAGADRFATSRVVAQHHADDGTGTDTMTVVTGDAFADALTAGPYAAERGSRMVLVPSTPSAVDAEWWRRRAGTIEALVAVGGDQALPSEVTTELQQLLSGAR